MTIQQMQKNGYRGSDEPTRVYCDTSGSMSSGGSNTITMTFASQVKIWGVAGGADTTSSASAALNFLDGFKIQISRQTGDRLFTNSVTASVVLGTPQFPLILPSPWEVANNEALTIAFTNNTSSNLTAYIMFLCTEQRQPNV